MIITKATLNDLDFIMSIINEAKDYLKDNNVNQWQDAYPNKEILFKDINNDELYVIKDNDLIIGVFALSNYEETYNKIYEGNWASDKDYTVIHRLAISNAYKGKGVTKFIFDYLKDKYNYIRVDTHRDNIAMNKCLINNGFIYRGIIYLNRDGDNKRNAYDYLND